MDDPRSAKKLRATVLGLFFISGILTASWNARIPDVQQSLQLNDAAWGTVLMALPAGLVTGLFVSSWLVASFGASRISLITCMLGALLLPLLGWADDRFMLMFFLFLVGVNRTIMNIGINTQSVEVQQHFSRPIISTFHGTWSIACFAAAGIGTLMIILEIIPFYHFLIVAFLIVIALFFKKKNKEPWHLVPEKKPLLIKPDQYLLLLGVIAFFSMAAENTMFDWSIHFFDKEVKADKEWRTAGYTCFILTMSAGRFLGDRLIRKFGAWQMLAMNGLLMGTGFLIASLFPVLPVACFAFLLIGFGDSSIVPIVYSLSGRSKIPMAYAIASVTSIGYLGFLVNPLIVGLLSEQYGMRYAFGLMVVFSLVSVALALWVRKKFSSTAFV